MLQWIFIAPAVVPQVLKMLLKHGLLHGDCMTITGETMAQALAKVPDTPRKNQDVIRQWDNPMYKQGHLAILKGNLSPEGLRRQDHRPQITQNHRSRARVQLRARDHGRHHGEKDQTR